MRFVEAALPAAGQELGPFLAGEIEPVGEGVPQRRTLVIGAILVMFEDGAHQGLEIWDRHNVPFVDGNDRRVGLTRGRRDGLDAPDP